MPTIKFTATPELPFDIAHLAYKAGDVLEMNDASARRWVRRGVAVYLPESEKRFSKDGLRLDDPTVWAYIHAGYRADAYPPAGYASQSTEEEIARAKAEEEKYFSGRAAESALKAGEMTANEVREELGLPELPIDDDAIFESPTVADFRSEDFPDTNFPADTDYAESAPKRRGRKTKVVGDVD